MGDLKTAETFVDCIFIVDSSTGLKKTGLSPTCTFIKAADGTRTTGTVAELGDGWYKCTDFVSDAAGTWLTEWAVSGSYSIHYPFKEFKVGGGQTADVYSDTQTIVADTPYLADAALPGSPTSGSIGALVKTNLDAKASDIKAKTDVIVSGGATATQVAALGTQSKGLNEIYDLVDTFHKLKRVGGTIITTADEQNLYIYDAPAIGLLPLKLLVDLTNMIALDVVVIREYYRLKSGGDYILKSIVTYTGVQSPPFYSLELEPNLYGFKLTIDRDVGTDKSFDYEVWFEEA